MAAREVRELRNLTRKFTECEARTKFIKDLVSSKVGLKEVEEFVQRE